MENATHPIEQTSSALEQVIVGSRLWFSFCPDADLEDARLVLTTLQQDPGQDILESQVEAQNNPFGARSLRGVATVNANGSLAFGGSGLQVSDLTALAEWAALHVAEHDVLMRLKNASLLRIQSGVVEKIIEDEQLWLALPKLMPIPGTPLAAGALLESVEVNADVTYWMTDKARDGRPAIAALLSADDPEYDQLRQLVLAMRGTGSETSGTLRRTAAGMVVLTTSDDLAAASMIVAALAATYPSSLSSLRGARVARTGDEGVVGTETPERVPDLQLTLATLKELSAPGDKAWFVFCDDYDGSPMLFMSPDRNLLKYTAVAAKAKGRRAIGEVRLSKGGFLMFGAKKDFENFVPTLAEWVLDVQFDHPGLHRLKGARFVLQNKAGEMVRGDKDDAAWSFLA